MHYYKRNLGDYAKKAGRLTMLQHGAYTLLIDACYDREKFPTLDEAIEWTWASTEAEIEAVKFVLNRFFILDKDNQYVQDRILQELLEYHSKADKNKQIAIEREANRKQMNTKRERTVNEPSPNQEPITNNHKPIKNIVSNDIADCPHQEIIELYRTILPMGTIPRAWDKNRATQLKARWREDVKRQNLDWWKGFFEYIAQSDFLSGKIPPREGFKQFVISMDFIIKASNFTKIREGHYHNG
jgi:uncharacterized protein YdaU (DUF1376 family)